MNNAKFTTGTITRVGILGALAAILYAIPGIPIFPPIYKLDFSTLPALFGGFALGPIPSLIILLIKDVTGIAHSSSGGIGELADFLMSAALVLPAVLLYQRNRTRKGAVIGLIVGIICMAIVGALANYYIMIPFYMGEKGMAEEAIVASMAKIIPAIDSLLKMILLATTPFNLIKGIALAIPTFFMYKPLSPLLKPKKE